MSRFTTVLGAVLLAFLLTVPAAADTCSNDPVPAATLLVPYFEVDMLDSDGVNTLFTIHNAEPEATLAHITLWTDWSLPSVTFDVFLTGFDVVTVDLRDVFVNGNIPITADDQSDVMDSISPHGANPEWDGSFQDCQNFFPFFNNPVIQGTAYERLVNGHTGKPVASAGGQCLAADLDDNIARGYVTIDDAVRCSIEVPPEPGYFGGNFPVASDDNQLWGEVVYIEPGNFEMSAMPLVHLEADPEINAGAPWAYTFYGRYTRYEGGEDHREPLATSWAFHFNEGGPFTGGTDLVAWRDSGSDLQNPFGTTFTCGNGADKGPDWWPLEEYRVRCFNESESFVELCDGPEEIACFPLETQKIEMQSLGAPWSFGWCEVDFEGRIPQLGGPRPQSFVAAFHSAAGLFAGGMPATELAHACDAYVGVVFADGFESGNLSSWSTVFP